MNPYLRLVMLAATTVVAFGLLAALVAAVLYPAVRARHARLPAAVRARRIASWAAAPWLVGGLLVALCFLPSMWSALGIAADHCPLHDDGHVHLCLEHAPRGPVSLVEWLLLGVAATGAGIVFARVVAAQFATWRAVVALVRSSGKAEGGLIPSNAPLSVTAGLFRPLVLVSTGLRERLRPDVLAVVLEHERAHARRRDPLRLVTAALLSAGHLPGTRHLLLADLALACEQAADEEAATAVGDRVRVAEAIVTVERVMGSSQSGLVAAMGMDGASTISRVEELLREPSTCAPTLLRGLLWGVAAVAAVLLASTLHHLTETLLEVLAR
jgi:Zn-dependent protease with chaperone function